MEAWTSMEEAEEEERRWMEGFLRGRVCSPCQREDWEDESAWKQERQQGRIGRCKGVGWGGWN